MKENQNIEWKETWRDEYIKWICGFANAAGGILVIGKNNKGDVTGVDHAEKLMADIPNKVRDIMGIIVDVNLKRVRGKEFLEIMVEPHPYPVSYKGQYHYRSGSTKQELKGSALDAFLLKKYGLHWDSVPVPNLIPESLEEKAFAQFAKKAVKSKRLGDEVLKEKRKSLLRKLHLVEGSYLKRAAALLFHEDPEQYVTGAYIKIGFFKSDSDLIYQDEIHGNLFQQVDKTLDLLLTKYMKAYISYEGLQRVESYLFPAPALREALLNAVIHKDYSSGNPVQISVYDGKIIFWNAGRLPEELSIELLQKKHPSIPYNPLVASAFFRAGYIEAWGRGIEKINDECKLAGVPVPELNYDYAGLMITFQSGMGIKIEKSGEIYPITAPETGVKTGVETREKTREKILKLILDNPSISTNDMSKRIGISKKGIEWQIKRLKKDGTIQRIGPAKGGYWKVQGKADE